MSSKLRVLLSAYACEPHQGSEPEVGWQWALQMARFHDVTVLTQSKNQTVIERTLQALPADRPRPRFIYHTLPLWLHRLRETPWGFRTFYFLWQKSARKVIARLHREHHFDLMHHVTFAGFRYPTVIWDHGVPCIWGPIGGIESIPWPLLPWRHPASFIHEATRNVHNLLHVMPFHALPGRARASALILATTKEMQLALARLGFAAEVMPTIGLNTGQMPYQARRPSDGPLKLLYVGNVIALKGIDLALEAFAESGIDATLTLVGTGSYLEAAKRLAAELRLQARVTFLGRLPRQQVLRLYPEYDVFVFPSLHDTGGYAVIEAMFNELPVICLDCGGPAVAVQAGCGVRVSLGARAQVISELASALRLYAQNRATLAEHGKGARQTVLRFYDWDRKGDQMDHCYRQAVRQSEASHK
jgi:glycosyltransferase involved in cell wall biosynthesis